MTNEEMRTNVALGVLLGLWLFVITGGGLVGLAVLLIAQKQ